MLVAIFDVLSSGLCNNWGVCLDMRLSYRLPSLVEKHNLPFSLLEGHASAMVALIRGGVLWFIAPFTVLLELLM